MKKIVSIFIVAILIFIIANPTQASYQYYEEPPFETYKMSEGDTLSHIAERYGVDLDDLYRFNFDIGSDFLEGSSITLVDNTESSKRVTLSSSERDLLERLVHAEARGQEYEGKVAVAEVVFNRVDSSDFPDSVYEVITQKRQFEPYTTGTIENNPDDETVKAVEEALKGTDLVDGALFFWNPSIATSRWLEKKTVVTKIDNHEFLE
ncbi:cell wall hydrolase [Salipaludibacillus daqingensis]|uniref:cell wall hydrolase n=1 Tax=Salipaludibacillus daqingensis TaxID=3041001 RepID=UPI0024760890|nr:cell wall hydrolase [Salipaludibacillus daqingensis]